MIKKLRKKFVIVTMSMLIVVFSILITIIFIVNERWSIEENAGMLEWIAYSGVFTAPALDFETQNLIVELNERDASIIGVVVDQEGEVVSARGIGKNLQREIPYDIIYQINKNGGNGKSIGNYVYSILELFGNRKLIVLMDMSVNQAYYYKYWYRALIVVGGLAVLLLISIKLSKFVIEPARTALEREKRFIADASHELKTPLSAISINAQALEPQEKDAIYLNNITSEASRMGRMIERMLTLSKFDENEITDFHEISLSDICEEMSLTYESMAFESSFDYNYEVEPDLKINGNEDEMRQLFAILIDNAIKNTNENGSIKINCCKADANASKKNKYSAKIEVRNVGKGISEEDLPHIFDRFYTTDKSRNNKSFGLGLAIAKAIVERHRGNIYAFNEKISDTEVETVFIVEI